MKKREREKGRKRERERETKREMKEKENSMLNYNFKSTQKHCQRHWAKDREIKGDRKTQVGEREIDRFRLKDREKVFYFSKCQNLLHEKRLKHVCFIFGAEKVSKTFCGFNNFKYRRYWSKFWRKICYYFQILKLIWLRTTFFCLNPQPSHSISADRAYQYL